MLFSRQLHRRFLSKTTNIKHHQHQQWSQTVKQVTKSNFHESLNDLKTQIHNSDYIAISSKKTGIFSSPWKRFLPFIDTPETAYLKAKESAEKYQILQFSVCPFTLRTETASSNAKAVAYPYNFQLFPREEGYVVMPSYSFSCQTSCLTSMAREGFDFNECIYEGISYLSREQEYVGKHRAGSSVSDVQAVNSSATADAIYLKKIKSHVQRWRRFCENKIKETEDPLLRSLRKMILGGEMHGSRPCVNIDVCNERHVQLVQELVNEFYDDLVPLVIPHKGGGPKLVRVVLTSSKEDKNLFQTELRDLEEEQNKQVRGFREVIELISTSQKPIVTHNCLREFTFIHSKFLGPLPLALEEFSRSLHPVFPYVLDVNHLMKKIGPLKKATNISAAIAYMKRQFFVPLDMEIGLKGQENEGKHHDHSVLLTTYLFAKLNSILKVPYNNQVSTTLKSYLNIFNYCTTNLQEQVDGENVGMDSARKASTADIIFLWGITSGISAEVLKTRLQGTHDAFSEDFEVRLVDRSCAVLVFWKPSIAAELLKVINSGGEGYNALRELIEEGLRAANYDAYKRVCRLGFWETDLADLLDKILAHCPDDSKQDSSEILWSSDLINLEDL